VITLNEYYIKVESWCCQLNYKTTTVKRVIFNSGLYAVITILQKAVGFILLPLYTFYLSPSDYGITGLVTSLTGILSVLFTLSLNAAISRFYFDYRDDEDILREFWGTIVTFILVNSIIVSTVLLLFKDYLIMPFMKGINFYPYIFIGILTIIVTPVYTIYQSILQTKQEAIKYSINNSLFFVLTVILNILLIVVFKLGALGMLLASFLTGIVFAIYTVYNLLHNKLIVLTIKKKYLFDALKYSMPLIPHLMSGLIASFVSKIFLNTQQSISYVGLFNIGSQFLLIIDTIQMSVNDAYIPWYYDLMSKGKEEHYKVIQFADFLLKINCLIGLAFVLFTKEIVQIITRPAYLLAWVVVPVMVIAYQVRGIYLFHVNTLFYNKRATKFIFIATLSGNLISIVLSALLTGMLGIMTPAIVLLIEKTITATIIVLISKKMEPIGFKLYKMIGYVAILAISIGVGLIFDIQNPLGGISFLNILYKLLIIMTISFLLMRSDLKNIKDGFHSILNRRKH
jgi:O-antigen/teichoic acid export membrane protein